MEFNITNFKKFNNSTQTDGNYVGLYENNVVRVFEERVEDIKELLLFIDQFPQLIDSEIIYEDNDKLLLKHSKLEFISYYKEWTQLQKIQAAKCVINLQEKLVKKGFSLIDPHSFNITFEKATPVYFDVGSIQKKIIKPNYWFLKSFCGLKEKDYWDSVLRMNLFVKLWITLRLTFSKKPYTYLSKKITRYSNSLSDKVYNSNYGTSLFSALKKILRRYSKNLTNWTNYNQTIDNNSNEIDSRTESFIANLNKYKPKTLLDIGANKGAFTKLSLQYGVEKAIAIDLDDKSLEVLRGEILKRDLPIWTAKIDVMNYEMQPGCYNAYYPAHQRYNLDFVICFAVVHHLCYFGDYTFDQFGGKLDKFANKVLLVEFVPFEDIHLTGPAYKGEDKSWYTLENFIASMKKYFPRGHEIFESVPKPRILVKFEK